MSAATTTGRRPRATLQALLARASSAAATRPLLRRLKFAAGFERIAPAELRAAAFPAAPPLRVYRCGAFAPLFLVEAQCELGPRALQPVGAALRRLAGGPCLLFVTGARLRTVVFGCCAPDGPVRASPVVRLRPRAADLQLVEELAASPEGDLARLMHWASVLDRGTVGSRFFREIRAVRDTLSRAWTGLPAAARTDRDQLALLLLCRLLFLAFLQERGHLLGDRDFLARLVREWRVRGRAGFYAAVLEPLFFGVFNTRPELRSAEARALGPLPYLNGGLFERHALERRHRAALPDAAILAVFSAVLGRYRFTARDVAENGTAELVEASIDPEVLGRVFESLMNADVRGDTGTFYTPPDVVARLVGRALAATLSARCNLPDESVQALLSAGDVSLAPAQRAAIGAVLRELRVLDPACGSGAFLLGAMSCIAELRSTLEPRVPALQVKREIVAETLHGVDLLPDAALLCALRLWLALAPAAGEAIAPLPNLDRRIRQGDALIDPLDILTAAHTGGAGHGAALAPEVRQAVRSLEPLGREYLVADPAMRPALLQRLQAAEATLARTWLQALRERVLRALAEADASADARDLWGLPLPRSASQDRARTGLQQRLTEVDALLRRLDDAGAIPFFSFLVHFAAERAGFDLVLANPPWVRAHRWPAALAEGVRQRFRVCRQAGWPGARAALQTAGNAGGQVDLALLFLERAIDLLSPDGTLAMLLPAKLLRSLYAGGARALLLERTAVVEIEDHSLDQHAVFAADAFTVSIVARRGEERSPPRITLRNRNREPLTFNVSAAELPLVPGDGRSPWLLAPPPVLAALRKLQQQGEPLGAARGVSIRRGVITGANDVLVISAVEPGLGGLSRIRAQGWFRRRSRGEGREAAAFTAWVESAVLRPLVRGCDVKAWRWSAPAHVLWVPGNDSPGLRTPDRAARYLARHAPSLRRRDGAGRNGGGGRLLRVSPELLGHKVVWQDIADDLHAVAIPDRVANDGRMVPVIPLNTVYFAAVRSRGDALALSALLNSLPLRVFARSMAERAKDARFRFFAWTVAALPVPRGWREGGLAAELADIAQRAHELEGIDAAAQQHLDRVVAAAFGLSPAELTPLQEFARWLDR